MDRFGYFFIEYGNVHAYDYGLWNYTEFEINNTIERAELAMVCGM